MNNYLVVYTLYSGHESTEIVNAECRAKAMKAFREKMMETISITQWQKLSVISITKM